MDNDEGPLSQAWAEARVQNMLVVGLRCFEGP